MSSRSQADVLVTGLDDESGRRIGSSLQAAGCAVTVRPLSDATLLLVEDRRFAAIVSGHPRHGVSFGQLLSSVRAATSACHGSGLVLLVPADDVRAVRRLVGRGVNRVVADDAPVDELTAAVADVQDVAPRRAIRLPVQLEVSLPRRLLKALCQTENISESGMLLRGFQHYPTGTVFEFEIQLPGEGVSIKGKAEIARTTNTEREPTRGFGARFVDLDSDDQARLASLLGDLEAKDSVN